MTEAMHDSAPDASLSDDTPQAQGGAPGPTATEPAGAAEGAEAGGAVEASDRAELERMREQLLRTAADFDNFRKRSRRELEDAKRVAREDVVRDLLPIFDNLERGMASAQRATEVKALAEGLQMILKQFLDTVAKMGVTKIPAVGSPFDPNVHEAIQQVETAEQAPGTVIAEVQPGYLLGERLLRAAMVVVAKSKAASASSEPGSGPAN